MADRRIVRGEVSEDPVGKARPHERGIILPTDKIDPQKIKQSGIFVVSGGHEHGQAPPIKFPKIAQIPRGKDDHKRAAFCRGSIQMRGIRVGKKYIAFAERPFLPAADRNKFALLDEYQLYAVMKVRRRAVVAAVMKIDISGAVRLRFVIFILYHCQFLL